MRLLLGNIAIDGINWLLRNLSDPHNDLTCLAIPIVLLRRSAFFYVTSSSLHFLVRNITLYFVFQTFFIRNILHRIPEFPDKLPRKITRIMNHSTILIRKNLVLRWNLTLHCWTLPKHEKKEPCVIDESLHWMQNSLQITQITVKICQRTPAVLKCKMRAKIKKYI